MSAYSYFIGQTIQHTPVRDILGRQETAPTWHCLIVPPQREAAARAYFMARDIFAFYPSHNVTRHLRGKKLVTERPLITTHLYVQFRANVNWDVLKARRLITGVYCMAGVPVVIPSAAIRHLQGMTVEAERLKEARAEMLRVRPGDKARVLSGPLAGLIVDVCSIAGGDAWIDLLGGRVKASVKALERTQDLV